MAIFKAVNESSKKSGGAKDALDYVGKKAKETLGLNCSDDYKQAFKDFQDIKEFYNKLEDRQYKHFVHSFKPGEIDEERALDMTVKLCKEIFPENQVFIAQHTDKEHVHNHIVVNSVNFENGEKFYYTQEEWQGWRDRADELAQEYGLERVQEQEKEEGQLIANNVKTRKIIEKALAGEKESDIVNTVMAIIESGEKAKSKKEFEKRLKAKGINIDWGETFKDDGTIKYKKYITLTIDEEYRKGKIEKYRLDTLGKSIYSKLLNTEKLREHFKELELEQKKQLEEKKELEKKSKKKIENSFEKKLARDKKLELER